MVLERFRAVPLRKKWQCVLGAVVVVVAGCAAAELNAADRAACDANAAACSQAIDACQDACTGDGCSKPAIEYCVRERLRDIATVDTPVQAE